MTETSFLNDWLKNLGESIQALPKEQREALFSHCARHCADTGIKEAYAALFQEVQQNLDAFFDALNSWSNVGGEVIESNHIYDVIFKGGCQCDLYTQGYIQEPWICECSRQSFRYVMSSLLGHSCFQIEPICTVLNGSDECRFRITLMS